MTGDRVRVTVRGAVQGVGFRPFVHRLARELALTGWVRNDGSDVLIEAQGARVRDLYTGLRLGHPPHARVESIETEPRPPTGEDGFRILRSTDAAATPTIVPDLVTCPDCLREILDPSSRFHRYPFTNCTQCGPRYSIIERTPYDRAHTTMSAFIMCPACQTEYDDPTNRRFHAQPTACQACGPRLRLGEADGVPVPTDDPITAAAAALRAGRIVAVKGLGGFQLLVDATNAKAVGRLRARKHRPHKPLAVMVRDVARARAVCQVSDDEEALLRSSPGPIVLLKRTGAVLPGVLAPDHDTLGVMLPTTPLHHLLLRELGTPVVCTSGNRSEEPICIDDDEARERLSVIADRFLVHDRPIRRALDDSVARVIDGAPQVLRLARGYAPFILPLEGAQQALAVGPHLKNSIALGTGRRAIVSQHVGDLEHTLAVDAMRATTADLQTFFDVRPDLVACDLHQDYASSSFARELECPVTLVQHHLAHALACMLEHDLHGPLLAATWDGTGAGTDGTIWGGEFLRVERGERGVRWSRVAHLRPFRLPGGDVAARDARRALGGLEWELPELHLHIDRATRQQLAARVNSPACTSIGRLFDGMAALLGLGDEQTYEAQAAARLERVAASHGDAAYELPLMDSQLDWRMLIEAAHRDHAAGVPSSRIAAKFHDALATSIVHVARAAGETTVLLTGGCFQNRLLTERALAMLRAAGFDPVISRQLPPNDGGVALGQLVGAQEGVEDVPCGPRED